MIRSLLAVLVIGLAGIRIAWADIPPQRELVPKIVLDISENGLTIIGKTLPASPIAISAGNGGVLFKFSGPLAALDTDGLVIQAHGRLSAVEEGYDTILFRSETLRVSDTSTIGGQAKGLFMPIPQTEVPSPAVADGDTQEDPAKLLLTLALINSMDGDFADANQTYETALSLSPNNPDALIAYGNNEEEAGNWRHAQDLFHNAVDLDPDNQEADAAALRVDQEHQRYGGTDVEWRDLHGFGIILATSTTFDQPINDDWRATMQFDADHVSTGSARRLTGEVLPAHQWTSSESVGAGYDNADGFAGAGYLFTGYKPGVAAQASLPTDSGHTLVGGEFDRPNWDYLEGLVDDGTRDRVYMGQQEVFSYNLSGELILGYNFYNLGPQRNLANGPAVAGELRYQFLHDYPSFAAIYNLDAEYSVKTVKRDTSDGEQYEPFPLENREVHTLVLDTDNAVADILNSASSGLHSLLANPKTDELSLDYGQLDLFAGGGFDRYGRPGPLVGGSWTKTYDIFQVELRTSYERGLDRESQSGTIAGGYVKARF